MRSLLTYIGKARGRISDKHNRVQRLVDNWDLIKNKMIHFIEAGQGTSLRARCAYGVLLMMETGIRIGNESSAEGYICDQKHHQDYGKTVKVYGLTTLLPEHINKNDKWLRISFLGKKAVEQSLHTSHSILLQYANTINLYHGKSTWLGIDYGDMYSFIKRSLGNFYKPKDLRTAAVNVIFVQNVENMPEVLAPSTKTLPSHLISISNISRKGDINKLLNA